MKAEHEVDAATRADQAHRWWQALDDEDRQFLKRFLLASGSLKALAEAYGISYPTIRLRLDRLIAKVQAVEDTRGGDALEQKVRVLVADGRLSAALAKELLQLHRQATEQGDEQ
jgi:hypothetical protein